MGRVQDKVCLITGGGLGMGREHAKLLAEHGGKILLTDFNDEAGQKTVAEIKAAGGDATFMHHDVSSEEDWAAVIDFAIETFGGIDVLVNNAGILLMKAVHETTTEEWDRVQNVNTRGVFFGIRAVLPAMQKRGGGSIINISSIYGIIGAPSAATYQASKGAVRLLTKSTAVDYAPFGIRVNSVHPGVIKTDMLKVILGDDVENVPAELLGTTVLGRAADPKEISWGVLFLASDEASFMTGSELVIDGGYTCM